MKKDILVLVMIIVFTTNQSCALSKHTELIQGDHRGNPPPVPVVPQGIQHDQVSQVMQEPQGIPSVPNPLYLPVRHDLRYDTSLPGRDATDDTKKLNTWFERFEQISEKIVVAVKNLQPAKVIDFGAILIALVGWLCKVHITHAFRRFNLIKTLQIDIAHRIKDGLFGYDKLSRWYNGLPDELSKLIKAGTLDLPILKPFAERHVLYKSVQSEMVECLWGKEIHGVRDVYRWLSELEELMRRIQTRYECLIRAISTTSQIPSNGNAGLDFLWNYTKKDIRENVNKYCICLKFLLNCHTSSIDNNPTAAPVLELQQWCVQGKNIQMLVEDRFISVGNAYMTQAFGFVILEIAWVCFYLFGWEKLETSTLKIITTTLLGLLTIGLFCWSYQVNVKRIRDSECREG